MNRDQMDILIVDDDELMISAMRASLMQLGFYNIIYTATRVEDAIRIIRKYRVDLIITDFSLRDGNALDIMVAARERFSSSIKIIVMSGDLDANMSGHAEKLDVLGAFGRLKKPFDISTLDTTITRQDVPK